VFSTKQVFIFSLIPLALVFAGVIVGSMDGVDAERQVYPTQAPVSEATTAPPTPSSPGETVLQLTAENVSFDKRALTASTGASVTIQFNNKDAGVSHNFALYTDASASQKIFSGDLSAGPEVVNYTFDAPAPGTYYFRCDVHPDTMNGSFTVK
jgi:plastocyanin